MISAFKDRFSDFQKVKPLLDLFRNSFAILLENAPESVQLELIDMQKDENLQNAFNEDNLLKFYRCIDKNNYKSLLDNALKCSSLFGSIYICEQIFSVMNINKSENRNRLTNENLESILRLATTKIEPNIKTIVKSMQCNTSN